MLSEKEALLVSGLDEFGSSELSAQEFVLSDEAPRSVSARPYEAMLVARLKAGEMAAFEELVEEYRPLVFSVALRVLGDVEDARDVTQETFLKVYRHFSRFRGEASLKTWICRIAINQARSTQRWWRRRYRNRTTSIDAPLEKGIDNDEQRFSDLLPSMRATPEAETLQRERSRRLERALAGLKKDFRIAVVMRDIEGLSYEEIAYVTGVSLGTVKSRIARGREMLRESVQEEAGE